MADRTESFRDRIIDDYIVSGDDGGGPNHWTYLVVQSLLEAPRDVSWPLMMDLVARAPDRNLGYIAAGPLEDFLSHHGDAVVELIEAQADVDPRFRRALRGMYQHGMSGDVYSRVVAAGRPEEGSTDEERRIVEAAEAESAWIRDRFQINIEGMPPGSTADPVTEAGARRRLVDAIGSVEPIVDLPFAGPVFLGIVICMPGGPFPDAAAMIRAIVDELAGPVYPTREDVWDVRLTRAGSRRSRYTVEVAQMSEDQMRVLGGRRGPRSSEPADPGAYDETGHTEHHPA